MGGGKSGFANNGTQVRKRHKVIADFENKVRYADKEHLLITDINGNILDEVDGITDEVTSDKLKKEQLKDSITSHNHPDIILPDGTKMEGNIFSPDDMTNSAKNKEYEWHASTSSMTYIIRRKNINSIGRGEALAKAYSKAWEKAENKMCNEVNKDITSGKVPDTESAFLRAVNERANTYMRKWLRNHVSRYGYQFEERKK